MTRRTQNKEHKHGLAAVEMAMILPIFILLLTGIMDTGRMYWTQNVARNAAFEAARVAVINETTAFQIEEIAAQELESGGINDTPTVTVGPRQAEQPVDVTVTVPFEFLVIGNFIPSLGGTQLISATAVMTHER